ncbi:alpha/beta hydrolase [Okeanomitos corallinicola TIOX110]|uniref:Alpha/beta hydrolase n=1 Tax=Okeanomitos corallinicola TIOX110 TaxID=3133117 RepID=A0ABZ2UNX8_9CYAN
MNSLFGTWTSRLRKNSLLLVLSILLPIFGISNTVMAAEKIYVSYSILEIPIPVISLEKFTKTGNIDQELAGYQDYIAPQQLQKLREILLRSIKISPAVATQFLYTEQGEFLLHRLAKLIKNKSAYTETAVNDLRNAIIFASKEPGGLTFLNILSHYPSISIHVDLANSLEIAGELENLITETNQAIATIQELSKIESATGSKTNLSQLLSLQKPKKVTSKNIRLDFFDATRNRSLLTDVYLPNVQHPTPVIVISHGLGLNSSNFHYLAKHLASQGLAVVLPNHPQLFTSHNHNSKFKEAKEFINRPLDIKYILDQLENYNQSNPQFQDKLNLQQVGVMGQSFGGYTALALAGAKINFQQLDQDCHPDRLQNTWNMSLLLQCRALELLPKSQREDNSNLSIDLQDERVKAAIAINPITSSIFGKSGLNQIQTPVMFISSSEDTVAPALYEQIIPFSWLNNPDKYLVMLIGGTHFSTIGNSQPGSKQISLPADMVGNASQARTYINALSLPFFQTYVSRKPEYIPYLNAGYAANIADKSLGLSFIQSLKNPQLVPTLDNNIQKQLPFTIIEFGYWILAIAVSLLHIIIFVMF